MYASVLVAAGLILVGFIIRQCVRPIARLYIPASVIAGLIALAIVQAAQNSSGWPGEGTAFDVRGVILGVTPFWASWRDVLIPVVFACLLLERTESVSGQRLRVVAQQAIAAWVLILGQLALGLLVTWLLLRPAFGVPVHFGQLLEVSWAGGFGSSAAWGSQHAKLNLFSGAGDLATFFTTVGLLVGVGGGIVAVNIAIRRNWPAQPVAVTGAELSTRALAPAAMARTPVAVLDPILFQLLIVAAAVAAGLGLQQLLVLATGMAPAAWGLSGMAANLPLFVFTLLGGWVLRRAMELTSQGHLIDDLSLHRIGGIAIDLLIFSSLATLRLSAISSLIGPAAVLMLVGLAWCAFNLFWVSPRILPRSCWFELGIMNWGFSTATTSQGMMLLRMTDPELRTDAARVYAVAAPFTAVFIGGGIITYLLPPILAKAHVLWVIVPSAVAAVTLYFVGRRISRQAGSP